MWNESFWKTIVDKWICVQTEEDKKSVEIATQELIDLQNSSNKEKVSSILDELFG